MRFHLNSRNRIFIGVLLIYVCGVIFMLYNLMDGLDPRYRESAEDSMVETANLLASFTQQHINEHGQIDLEPLDALFKSLYQRKISAQIYEVHKNKIELRAYVVNHEGKVLYDSTSIHTGADFSRWRDVSLALRGEYGARTSPDIPNKKETSVMYVSAPIYWQDHIIGAVTIGKPIITYQKYITNAQWKILYFGIFSAIAIAILTLIVAVWLTRPLGLITEYIRYIRSQKSVNLPRFGRRALDLLGQSYENMRDALAGKHYVADYVHKLTHELKSPLSAIRGAAELLQNPMPEEQRQKFLQNIERETLRVQQLVDHMKELTALEEQRSIKKPQPILLYPLLDELTSSAQAIAAARHIQILLNLPLENEATLCEVEGDPLLLHRALRNLLDNAIDFTPDHSTVTVELKIERRMAIITIRDQGQGIPDYAQNRIFEKFYSLDRPSGKKKSSGLGLAFVQEITLLHHGSITLKSIENQSGQIVGAAAELKLPLNS
ncbi:MAG: two-component system sensor histidine kinase CreC [Saezia sp.]